MTTETIPTDTDFSAAFARMKQKSDELLRDWREWASTQPASTTCKDHGTMLPRLEEASVRESVREKEFCAVFEACPKCRERDKLVAASEWLRAAGVADECVLHASFDNFECRTAADRENLAAAQRFVAKGRGFIVLMGPPGLGKTHMAVAIMRASDKRSLFVTQSKLLGKKRKTYNDKFAKDPNVVYAAAGLLVLDEVGLSAGGRDELPMIHELLVDRHEARKPTVLTTNCEGQDELAEVIGSRMASRLRQSGVAVLVFAGPDMRPLFRDEYHGDKD